MGFLSSVTDIVKSPSGIGAALGGGLGFVATGGNPLGAAVGASLGGSLFGAQAAGEEQQKAAEQAAYLQAQQAEKQTALQRDIFEYQKGLAEQQMGIYRPRAEIGLNALRQMQTLSQQDLQQAPQGFQFGTQQFQADPGYAFRLAEGQKALERSAAARGGLISGGALKAAQRYGQEMGSQEFQRAYERGLRGYVTQQEAKQAQLNQLARLAGMGETAAAGQSQALAGLGGTAGQYAGSIGQIGQTSAEAQANALLAGAQARGSAYQGMGRAIGQAAGLYALGGGFDSGGSKGGGSKGGGFDSGGLGIQSNYNPYMMS